MISYAKVPGSRHSARCFFDVSYCPYYRIDDASVPKCPIGYVETGLTQRCTNCSQALGTNFVCPCTDWATCAQRTYGNFYGCHPNRSFMKFKIRECTKSINYFYFF